MIEKVYFPIFLYCTWSCDRVKDRNSFRQFFINCSVISLSTVTLYSFFMAVCRTHHLIDDISVVRHKQKSARIFVQSARISNTHRVVLKNERYCRVLFDLRYRRSLSAYSQLKRSSHLALTLFFLPTLTICPAVNAHPHLRRHSVYRHFTAFNKAVRLPSGTNARLA